MGVKEDILKRYKEFSEFLDSVDLDQMKREFSREELNEFKSNLYVIKFRSLAYEVGEITKKMKEEEFPELLGVHQYPVINEIDFLSDKEKLDLDKFLARHTPNRDYLQSLWKVVKAEENIEKVEKFLVEKGVVEERHVIKCPSCYDSHLSSLMTNEQKENLMELVANKADFEDFEEYISYYCDECSYELDPMKINEKDFKTLLKMVMKRDTSLDDK